MTSRQLLNDTLQHHNAAPVAVTPLHFHQVYTVLKCPVVGTCLTLAEQRKITRKAGWSQEDATDFDLHELLVSHTDEDNALARAAHALLHQKYGAKARELHTISLPVLLRHWDDAFASGVYGAELWAIATLPDVPTVVQRYVFGCVHMGMHRALEHSMQLERTVAILQKTCRQEQDKRRQARVASNALRKDYDSIRQKYQRLRHTHERMQQAYLAQQEELRRHRQPTPPQQQDVDALRDAVRAAQNETVAAHAVIAQLQTRLEQVSKEMTVQRTLALELHKEVGMLLKTTCDRCPEGESGVCETCAASCQGDCDQCQGDCPRCPRRILIVGGINRMESLYRRLVESQGGALEYHDGNMSGGDKRLEGSLQRADLVLCPVNCNSHTACLLVKKLCKKYNKPVQMMPNFSLTAISRAIAN